MSPRSRPVLCCSWIQIAKKIISKSKSRDQDAPRVHPSRQSSCPPQPHVYGHVIMPVSRTFNGSENDLSLNYNTMAAARGHVARGGRVRYSPDTEHVSGHGRVSPEAEIQMYKTRVIYHSRQDCAAPDMHEASV